MRNFIDEHPGVSLLLVFSLIAAGESLVEMAATWIL